MNVGEVRIAEDSDFALLKILLSRGDGWDLEHSSGNLNANKKIKQIPLIQWNLINRFLGHLLSYEISGATKVWTRQADNSSFRMIRLKTTFTDITADTLYDVLHDPIYRKSWDKHMICSRELGSLNPNNDVSYYALHCPPPLKNRDFVLQRSWIQTPQEYYIINHSVFHGEYPPQRGFVRGLSHLTGFLVTPLGSKSCNLGYVAHSDPGGQLPSWVTNKLSSILAPKMVKKIHKACLNYNSWKRLHNPNLKPWLYPEQISTKRILASECVQGSGEVSGDCTPEEDESKLTEMDLSSELDSISLSE